jgi:hypothetical protein
MVLDYPDGVGIFEGSWDLPHTFQDLELFGREGSMYMKQSELTIRKGRRGEPQVIPGADLPEERLDPLLYIASRVTTGQPVDSVMGLDVNVGAVEILEAAKQSIASGKPVTLK